MAKKAVSVIKEGIKNREKKGEPVVSENTKPPKKQIKKKTASNESKKSSATDIPPSIQPPVTVTVAVSQPTPERPYVIFEQLVTDAEAAQEYLARQPELDLQFERARKALNKWMPKLLKSNEYKQGHITGLSIRFRTRFGQPISPLQVVIAVNVGRKYDPKDLTRLGIAEIPKRTPVDGFPVKVLEGTFELLQTQTGSLLRSGSIKPANPLGFGDPLVGGVPIAPPGSPDSFGTLGVVFSKAGEWFGLTCHHVVDSSPTVEQVGPIASGVSTTRPIADVIRKVNSDHFLDGTTETVDCASLEMKQLPAGVPQIVFPDFSSGWIRGVNTSPGQVNVPVFYSTRRVELSDNRFVIWKFGAATGEVVQGRVLDTDTPDHLVNNKRHRNNFTVKQVNGDDFLTPGDSGSIIALEASVGGKPAFIAVGVLFAKIDNSLRVGLACNMNHVIDALGLAAKLPSERLVDTWQRP